VLACFLPCEHGRDYDVTHGPASLLPEDGLHPGRH
jgi:hypothetical protein